MKIAKYIFIPVFFSLIISGCASSVPKQEVEIALPVEKNIAPVDSSKESQIHDSVSTTKEVISKEERNMETLEYTVRKVYAALKETESYISI